MVGMVDSSDPVYSDPDGRGYDSMFSGAGPSSSAPTSTSWTL